MSDGPLVDIIAGARPNFVKVASIIRAIEALPASRRFRYRLVHTGQHHDAAMSSSFFAQLGLPQPDIHLGACTGSQATQTGAIMLGYESLLAASPSDFCLVVGDVTSTLACAITAKKAGIALGHVEAGLRCGDRAMPEEINRLATDAISDWFFTTSRSACDALVREGASAVRIVLAGNTMIDTLSAQLDHLRQPSFWEPEALRPGSYVVLTLHRPASVDDPRRLNALLERVARACDGFRVVFPIHPRTAAVLGDRSGLPPAFLAVPPQPYLEFNHLVRHARAVITDSGGVSEETTWLGVPCMTMRDTTERPETVAIGTNRLVGTDGDDLDEAFDDLRAGHWPYGSIPERWDGRAGARIADALAAILGRSSRAA